MRPARKGVVSCRSVLSATRSYRSTHPPSRILRHDAPAHAQGHFPSLVERRTATLPAKVVSSIPPRPLSHTAPAPRTRPTSPLAAYLPTFLFALLPLPALIRLDDDSTRHLFHPLPEEQPPDRTAEHFGSLGSDRRLAFGDWVDGRLPALSMGCGPCYDSLWLTGTLRSVAVVHGKRMQVLYP
ncbi:hypothetical protein VTO73DRAFT_403 [Trametes versicolor]